MDKNTSDPANFPFSIEPDHYRHLKLIVTGDEAKILLTIDPEKSLRGDTPLKLNSYDLSVDIELADALNRLRFSHPEVRVAVITSGHPQIFSAGANIYMLKKSSHAFKVNFCKYTNETRLAIEEASRFSNLQFIAALNGTAAGGGYELALACDRIILLDDKVANVSLPEVPLLGVLPGTGGLTRLVDKRKVRRDLADAFCTAAEGIKGERAKSWGLVDAILSRSAWEEGVKSHIKELKNKAPLNQVGIKLSAINALITEHGFSYEYVKVHISNNVAEISLEAPPVREPTNVESMLERGERLWLLQAFRELDDAILRLRFFYRDCGLWQWSTHGDVQKLLEAEAPLYEASKPGAHWFLRELALHIGRVLRRIDISARSMLCLVDEGSCYAGIFAELLLLSDRSYAKDLSNEHPIALSPINTGLLPGFNGKSRLEARFFGHEHAQKELLTKCQKSPLSAQEALKLGLITFVLDHIDFADEIRLFKEERLALSPDALSAMEANLRFNGPETLATKIFGRLSAWQNWVFIRDNASGEQGALSVYGEGRRPSFNLERC